MRRTFFNCRNVIKTLTRSAIAAALLLISVASLAEQSCGRVNAYWETNLTKLAENLSECSSFAWHKCSQAAAIFYDLNTGSLAKRAEGCGLSKPEVPGKDYTTAASTDTQQCVVARDSLKQVFENRAQARLACAAARAGGDDQEWLDAQCTFHRSRMANYHAPFRSMAQICEIDYQRVIAQR